MSTEKSRSAESNRTVKLYVPIINTQALIYDLANYVSVEVLLKIYKVPYEIVERKNVQFLSTTDFTPVVKFGDFIFNDFNSVLNFFTDRLTKNNLCSTSRLIHLTNLNNSVLYLEATIMSLIQKLENIEKYICWFDSETYNNETFKKYSSVYPFPLNYVITKIEYIRIMKYLNTKELNLTSNNTLDEIKKILNVFSVNLKDRIFFFGVKPKGCDALLYGHLSNLLCYYENKNYKLSIFQAVAKHILSDNTLKDFIDQMQLYINTN